MEAHTATLPGERDTTAPSVSVEDGPHGRTFVRLAGNFPIGWMGTLSLGIAEAGLSIERGEARRIDRRRWEIELELNTSLPDGKPAALDYLLLATRRRRQAPHAIVIEAYTIDRYPERGTLVLDLKGVDCVGFLGSLLDRLAGLLLFPVEMEIETVGSHAVDRLCLQGLGGQPPSQEAEHVLAEVLEGLRPAAPSTLERWSHPTRLSRPAAERSPIVGSSPVVGGGSSVRRHVERDLDR